MDQSSSMLQQLLHNSEFSQNAGRSLDAESQHEDSPTLNGSQSSAQIVPLLSIEELSTRWLTVALQSFDSRIPEVTDFQIHPFDINDFDTTVRLALSYTEHGNGPKSVLFKISQPLPAPHWGEFIEGISQRETAAYRELGYHNVCRIPTLYMSIAVNGRFNLLLEDNGSSSLQNDPQDSRHQAEAVLRELALLHGCFARHSPVSAPNWLLRPRASAELIGQRYQLGVENLFSGPINHSQLPEDCRQLICDFTKYVAPWHRYEKHILTITHGDMRNDNMLFTTQASEYRASLIGWKLAGLRNPMYDVASLLSNSLPTNDRRAYEAGLVERYRRQFVQSGIHYSSIDARQDYRFHLFAPLIFNLCASAFLGESASNNPWLIENIYRNCRALMDWDCMTPLKPQLQSLM